MPTALRSIDLVTGYYYTLCAGSLFRQRHHELPNPNIIIILPTCSSGSVGYPELDTWLRCLQNRPCVLSRFLPIEIEPSRWRLFLPTPYWHSQTTKTSEFLQHIQLCSGTGFKPELQAKMPSTTRPIPSFPEERKFPLCLPINNLCWTFSKILNLRDDRRRHNGTSSVITLYHRLQRRFDKYVVTLKLPVPRGKKINQFLRFIVKNEKIPACKA